MAAITFPASPALNDIHSVGTRSWKYNGTAWKLVPKTTDAILEGSNNLYYTDARVAAAPAVTALETRAGNIESDATTLAGRVTTTEENVSALNIDLSAVNTRVDNVITNAGGDYRDTRDYINAAVSSVQSALDTEKERVDAILSASDADKDSFAEIVQLINSVNTDSSDVFAGYVTSNNAAVAAIDGRVTTLESAQSNLGNRVITLESAIDAEASRLNLEGLDREAADSAEETRARTAEAALSSDLSAVNRRVDDVITNATGDYIDTRNYINAAVSSVQSALDTEISDRRSEVSRLDGRIDSEASRLDTVESEMDAVEGRASDIESAVAGVQGVLGDHGGRIFILETQVSSVEVALGLGGDGPGKQTKNALDITAPSHEEGRIWIDTTDMSSYLSYGGAWVEMDRI